MISYFILALTISLVSCDTFEARSLEFEERYFKEKSSSLLVELIRTLRTAYEKGAEEFDRVINDSDIKGILDHMDALTRRLAESIINKFKELIKKIDEATKPISEPSKRNLKESSTKLMKRLVQILLNAYKQGLEYFDRVVNDSDVQGILEHLGPLSRKIADGIINQFRELIEKIDEATKETQTNEKRSESSIELLKKLNEILLKAYNKGGEYVAQVINDPNVKAILDHLGPLSRRVAESIINNFRELIKKIDEATKEKTEVEKRDFKESSVRLLKKLVNILVKAFEKGSEAFYKAINDPDVKEILNSLDSLSRRTANFIIEKFKELVIKLDELTTEKPKSERGLIEDSKNNFKKLIQILINASRKGAEYFINIISDPDFVAIQENLNSIEQKIINSIIEKFLQIFDKIDKATKPNSDVPFAVSDWQEDATVQLKKLTQILLKAYRQGGEYFEKVINDSDVQNILQHLGPLTRRIATSLIDNFRELIEKIDNATKESTF